jgi:hypothetical protein
LQNTGEEGVPFVFVDKKYIAEIHFHLMNFLRNR